MSAKTRLWVLGTIIICAAVILVGVVGGLMPQLSAAKNTNRVADETAQLKEIQRTQLTALQQARKEASLLEEQLAELRDAIPETAASAAWVDDLHRAEGASEARVSNFEVGTPLPIGEGEEEAANQTSDDPAPQPSGEVAPIPITLQVIGPERADVAEFMRLAQAGDRLFTVRTLRISFESSGDDMPWRAEANGFLYYAASTSNE